MAEPIYDSTTERVYKRLPETYRVEDANQSYQLKAWLSGICGALNDVNTLVNRFDYIPPEDFSPVYDAPAPTRTNLMVNPSFEVNTTGWANGPAGQTLARSTAWSDTGVASILAGYGTATGGSLEFTTYPNDRYPIPIPGVNYAVQCRVRKGPGGAASRPVRMTIYWHQGSSPGVPGAVVGTTAGPYVDVNSATTSTLTAIGVPPANATHFEIDLLVSPAGAGDQFYFDTFLMEQSNTIGTYFDGDNLGSWTGTAHNSTSTQVDRTDTSDLTDPNTADAAWLPWLAQFVGITLPADMALADKRYTIYNALRGNKPGTKAAIAQAAQTVLTGSKQVSIYDHSTTAGAIGSAGAWDVLLVTRGPQTTSDPAVAVINLGEKPAGVLLRSKTFETTWASIAGPWTTLNGRTFTAIQDTGL